MPVDSRVSRSVAIALAIAGIVLAGLVLQTSLAAYLSEANPRRGHNLGLLNASGWIRLAEAELARHQQVQNVPAAGNLAVSQGAPFRFDRSNVNIAKRQPINGATGVVTPQGMPSDAGDGGSAANTTKATLTPLAEIRSWAERAARADPLNAAPYRIIGQIDALAGDASRTEELMTVAANLSIRDRQAVFWLMNRSRETDDTASVLKYANALLRGHSDLPAAVIPTLAALADSPASRDALAALLATQPPWRSTFFTLLPRASADARTPLDIMIALKDSGAPATRKELKPYVEALIAAGQHELAYYTWLQLLTPHELAQAGFLFNGSFESEPSGLPFDWVIRAGTGANAEIVQRPDLKGEHALFVEFTDGRVDFRGVSQIVTLASGQYELRAIYVGEIIGRRGLRWKVACAATGSLIGESDIISGKTPEWTELSFTFTVPASNCPAQKVWLAHDARSASEQFVAGSAMFDEVRIARSIKQASR